MVGVQGHGMDKKQANEEEGILAEKTPVIRGV
jgi:hypothetical protein